MVDWAKEPPPATAGRVDWSREPPPATAGRVDWSREPPPTPVNTPDQTARQSARAQPAAAVTALDLSQKTGLPSQWVQDNYDAVKSEHELATFRTQLAARPVTKAWADQSPQHAAAVREDMGVLGRIEGWFSGMGDAALHGFLDIGEAEAMREYMGSGGPLAKHAIGAEAEQKLYDSQEHSYAESMMRAVPQVALYASVAQLTGGLGLAGLLYTQNKGVLARRIQLAQPDLPEGNEPYKGLTDEQIDNYATVGSGAAAVTLAGLLGPFLRAVPGAKEAAENLTGGVLARVAATTVGRAAIQSLLQWGQHTFMGAAGMALQGAINEETVQKATGKSEPGEVAAAALRDFWHMLPVAATFGAWGPGKDFLKERGRITESLAHGATLDDLVQYAQESKLRKASPPLAEQLFGLMGRGARVYVGWQAAKLLDLPPVDVARAEMTQGSVAVPIEQYLARHADEHEQIREDVKMNPEGLTPKEAAERVKELGSMMSEEDAKALYGKMPGEGGFSYPLAGELTREQLAKGYNLKPEEIDAAIGPQDKTTPGRPSNTPQPSDSQEWFHGTSKELAEQIQKNGKFGPLDPLVKRFYDYSEFGRSATYLARKGSWWFQDPRGGRAQEYKNFVKTALKEGANVRTINSPVEMDAFAKELGFAGTKELMRAWAVDGLTETDPRRPESDFAKSDAVTKLVREKGIDAVYVGPNADTGREGSGRHMPASDQLAVFNPEILKVLEPDKLGPGQTQESQPLHEKMAAEYGGTPEEWAKRLTPEVLKRLNQNTPVSTDIPVKMATEQLKQKVLGDIQPGQFALDAKRATDALTKQAVKSADLAAKPGQESKAVVSRAKEAELKSARDAARAYATAAQALREKYDAALSKLQARGADDSAYRETFHAADAASGNVGYDSVFRGLIDAVSGAALPRLESLNALPAVLDRMQKRNSPVAFDPQVVTQLLSRGKAWDKMTPAEADHVLAAIKNLREAAKAEVQLGKQKLADAAANVTWEASHLPKVNEALVPGNTPWWNRVTKFAGAFHARALERLEILKSLGATIKEHVVDGYYTAAEKEDSLYREYGKKYEEISKTLPEEMKARRFENVAMPRELAEAYQKRGLTPNPDRKFLWMTALMWGDAAARQRHTSGLGVEHDVVNNWLADNMTPEEWKFVEKVGQLGEGLRGELFAKEKRKAGVEPEPAQKAPIFDRDGNKVAEGWYFPLARDRRAFLSDGGVQQADGPKSPMDLFGPDYVRPAVQHRFVKDRAQQSSYVVDLNWDRLAQHIGQVIHDIAFDEYVTNASKLLLHPEVDKVMKERLGMEKRDQVHAWLYVAANERAEAAQGLGQLQKAFTFLRSRTQSSALGNNLPVIAAMATHSVVSLVHGEVRPSGAVDYIRALKPEVRQFAVDNFEAVRQRDEAGRRQLQDDMGLLGDRLRDSKVGHGLEIAAKVAAFGQNFMDHTMAVGLATAKYNEVMAAPGGTHEAAVAAANDMVRGNLQPRRAAEKSMIMNDKGALSAILIFHGFFNKVYNKVAGFAGEARQAWADVPEKPATGNDEWAQKQQEEYSKARSEAAWKTAEASGKFIALLGVLGLGKLALGRGREGDESWMQWALRTVGGAGFDMIPLMSNITQPIIDKAVSGKARPVDFRAAPALAGLQKVIQSVQAAASENRSDRAWKAADAAIMAVGAGSSQYTHTLRYATGPKGQRDFDLGRVGSLLHGVGYGEQNTSETLPLLIENLIRGVK